MWWKGGREWVLWPGGGSAAGRCGLLCRMLRPSLGLTLFIRVVNLITAANISGLTISCPHYGFPSPESCSGLRDEIRGQGSLSCRCILSFVTAC